MAKRHVSVCGVSTIVDVIWGNMPPEPFKMGINRQIQAKMPKCKIHNISEIINLIKKKF